LTGGGAGQILPKEGDALPSVGRSHSSVDIPQKRKGAKDFGYSCQSILKQLRKGVGG
jgi:hypothetical protein